jgi:hypothetical protein
MVSMALAKTMQFFAASFQLKIENNTDAFKNRDLENLVPAILLDTFFNIV